MELDVLALAIDQHAAAKRRQAEIQRARQKEAKRRAAATSLTARPKYTFDRKLRRFIEVPVREINPRKLEIDGELVSWPELAGKYSAPCMRRAGEVWREAKREYGLEAVEAEAFARKRFYDEATRRFYTWPEYASMARESGKSEEQAGAAWISRGLRFPPIRRDPLSTLERGNLEREGAFGTGLVGGRARREPKPPPNPVRGGFTTRGRAEPAPQERLFPIPERKVHSAPRAPPPAPVVEWETPPTTPGGSLLELASLSRGRETVVESPRYGSSATTPRYIASGMTAPVLAGLDRNPAVDRAVASSVSAGEASRLIGTWRVTPDGVPIPWASLILPIARGEYQGARLGEEDNNLLYQLYTGGWVPESKDDFFAAKSGAGTTVRLEKAKSRRAALAFLTFLESFWSAYNHLRSVEASRTGVEPRQLDNRGNLRSRLPDFALKRLRVKGGGVSPLSPGFWRHPPSSKEDFDDYIQRLGREGREMGTEYFNLMR